MAANPATLEDLLVARKLLTTEQVTSLQARSSAEQKPLATIIREEKIVFPETLAQVEAEYLGVPYVDLSQIKRNPSAMQDISRQAAATYRFVAFEEQADRLLIAMERPDDFQALQAVRFIAKKKGLRPDIYLSSREGIDRVLGMTAEIQAEIGGALKDFSRDLEDPEVAGKAEADLERFIEDAPVSKVVAVIIRHAIEGAASDIHIEPTEKELRVRYRIDGVLHTSLLLPLKAHPAVVSRIKILSNLKIDELRLPQDGRFTSATEGRKFDFRVATMPTTFGEKVVLRILDKSGGAPSFDELGLWGPQQEMFTHELEAPNGIILITGPTGSGKSTTLFTSLSRLNSPSVNIVTLEDPVEYEVEGVNQTQVHPDIGLTFATGLRSVLRQDPDIVMIGEIRDKDTAELAIHASLTGHLVLATLHTNDAIGAVPRLIDMGIDGFLLTASLRLLAAQRLVVRLCQKCKEEVPLTPAQRKSISQDLEGVPDRYLVEPNQLSPRTLYRSPGCPACQEGSSLGRLAIYEVVLVTKAVRDAINESAKYDTLREVARREGALTMRQDGILKALAGQVQYEDVVRVTSEEEIA